MAYQLVSQSAVGLPQTATMPGVAPVAATPQQGLLSMPDFAYDSSGLALDKQGTLQAQDMLGSYYNQMAEKYVPALDTFARENAGRMVAFDPNKLMTAEDFGLGDGGGINRGSLRNQDLLQATHDLTWQQNGDNGALPAYYSKDASGRYRVASGQDGEELYALTQGDDGMQSYTTAGKYHKETAQEAMDRLLKAGGAARTGGVNDFMGETALANIAKDNKGKWGQDFVNLPEMQQYLDNPAWVTKTDGKVTAVRAELLPYVLRESIGEEFRDMTRGGTKSANGLGDLIGMVVIGMVTAGFGTAAATGMGMTTTTGALTTAGKIAAGAIGGGMSSGLQGGNILEGAALGGLGAAATPYISKPLADAGLTNTNLNAAATRGITGGVKAGIQGKDVATGVVADGIAGAITDMMPKTGVGFVDKGITGLVGNVVGGYVGQLLGNTPAAAPTAAPAAGSTPATTATPTPVAASNTVARQSRVII